MSVEDGERALTVLSFCTCKILQKLLAQKEGDHRAEIGAALAMMKGTFDDKYISSIAYALIEVDLEQLNLLNLTTISTFCLINYELGDDLLVKLVQTFVACLADEKLHRHIMAIGHSCMKNLSDDKKKGLSICSYK